MASTGGEILRFGTFEVDTRSGEVRKAGARVRLQEKPLQVLFLLLAQPGELITRDELRERLWPADTFVDFDHSLATAVAKLRTALGDSARNPRFVETLGGRGYRFIAPVARVQTDLAPSSVEEPAPPPTVVDDAPAHEEPAAGTPGDTSGSDRAMRRLAWVAGSVVAGLVLGALLLTVALAGDVGGIRARVRRYSSPPVRSLAVLPLRNLSADPSQEYFVDGMTEQLITVLAQLPGIQVISRTSAMHYKGTTRTLPEIGRELNADAIVEGSVVRAGGRVRISAQLVDARSDQHVWAHSYERDAADVLLLQQEVAQSIAGEIRIQLSSGDRANLARARTVVPAAHEAYLRGRYHLNKGTEAETNKSLDDFNEAVRLDPSDAASYAGMAQAYVALTDFYQRPTVMMPRARAAAEHAVMLDDHLADAYTALGAVRFLYDWDWARAEAAFTKALALNPASADAHVWYAVFLAQMGRFDAAVAEIARATSLDPLSVPVHINAGWVFYLARRNDRALPEWKKALELEPALGVAHTSIWLAYAQQGQSVEASSVGADPQDTSPLNLATLAGVYAVSGRPREAEATLARLHALAAHRYVCPYEIATAHAALHQDEETFQWLRRGIDDRSSCMPDLKVDPRFDRLRSDPRFLQLLRDIGFAT